MGLGGERRAEPSISFIDINQVRVCAQRITADKVHGMLRADLLNDL
jgi:hypothetical protein